MSDVLLTYSWVRSSYAAMRNLSSHGVSVVASDSYSIGMCRWSRLRAGFEKYTPHYADESAFVKDVESICVRKNIKVVLPSHNETEILSRHRNRLPTGVDVLLPKSEHCALFNNKAKAYDLAKALGVPVPARIEYSDVAQVAALIAARGLRQVVIKLLTGNSAKGVFYADSPMEAERLVASLVSGYGLTPDRYPQIEECVAGEGVGCSVLYWNGEPVADYGHRRLREKIVTGGTSTLRETFPNEEIRLATHRIFGAIGWHGLAMAEYKYCSRSGKFWFIEVNPRMWGSIPLAISSGVEFPYLSWLCAVEGIEAARAYHAQTQLKYPWRGRWLLGDAILAASQLARFEFSDAFSTLFSSKSDALDDFHWDDPGAFLGEVAHYGSRFLSTLSTNPAERGMVG